MGNKEHTLTYGKFLPANPVIIAVKEPSFIKKAHYKQIIDELMETQICESKLSDKNFKKLVATTTFGLLEQHINKNSKSFIFDTYNDCKFYQAKYGGLIHNIKQYEERASECLNNLDWDLDEAEATQTVEYVETGREIFVLNLCVQADMRNGFRYIKELLMQHFNNRMQQSYDKLKAAGVEVYGVKTDAFTIKESDLGKAVEALGVKMPDDKKEIGDWRYEDDKVVKFPYEKLTMNRNKIPDIVEPVFNNIPLSLEDEYNTDLLCEHFERYKRVMVRAKFPGCGKSFACEHMEKRGHKVLFVCPTNKLASNYGKNGITLNKFFGIGLTEESKHKRFNSSEYDTVVFDEIFFASIRNLTRIKRFCDENLDKIIIATGTPTN